MTNERVRSLLARASLLLAALALTAASGFVGSARQAGGARQRPRQQQEEKLPPELAPQQLGPEVFGGKFPKACEKLEPDVQTHDVNDNFAAPGSAGIFNTALTAYATFINRPIRGYDEGGVDKFFYDSFKLRSCRVCYARLELVLKHDPDPGPVDNGFPDNPTGKSIGLTDYHNDGITVGGAPFSPAPMTVLSAAIWPPLNTTSSSNPKTMTVALPTNALNNYITYGQTPPQSLDVVIQDDTYVDYITLKVWYF
jgi:hypothetical protein